MNKETTSIADVFKYPLKMHNDSRGWFCEIFREEWDAAKPPQWNTIFSKKNTLRGVHVHLDHYDYVTVPFGKMLLGLKDLRIHSSTYGVSDIVTLSPQHFSAWLIPPGVAHGFFFPEDSIVLYGLSNYWRADLDLACIWNDPDLGIDWPASTPIISKRDQEAASLKELCALLRQHCPQQY